MIFFVLSSIEDKGYGRIKLYNQVTRISISEVSIAVVFTESPEVNPGLACTEQDHVSTEHRVLLRDIADLLRRTAAWSGHRGVSLRRLQCQ